MLYKLEHLLLRLFQYLFQRFVFQITGIRGFLINLDQSSQDRLILNNLRIVFDIR